MPENKEAPKYEFFVFIVESPSAPDLYHGRFEGGLVAQAIRLDSIPCAVRFAINREAFIAAFRIGLIEAMKLCQGRYPIIHISAHGNSAGIQLSSGEVVSWQELRELLVPINVGLQGALLLCMSACKGFSAIQMAMEEGDGPHPYFAMVGHCGTPSWSDTAVSYLCFYHILAKGKTVLEAVAAMRAASGDANWGIETADEIKRGYLEFIKTRVEPADAQRELEAAAEDSPLPAAAKALEASLV